MTKQDNFSERRPQEIKTPLGFKLLFFGLILLGAVVGGYFVYTLLGDEFPDFVFNPEEEDFEPVLDIGEIRVEILDLESPGSPYFSEEPIVVRGAIEVDTLQGQGMNLDIDCNLANYNGSVEVEPTSLEVEEGKINFRRSFACSFEEGIFTQKTVDNKEAEITASFLSSSSSKYEIYVLKEEEYESLVYNLGRNPFDEYGIVPDSLESDGTLSSEIETAGPIFVDLYVDSTQPFKEGEEFLPLEITILDVSDHGNIAFLESLELKVPSMIELSSEELFCDFEFNSLEGAYVIYSLRQEIIDEKINEECSQERLEELGLSEERCIDRYKKELTFKCDMDISQIAEGEGNLIRGDIFAEANYNFEIKRTIGVEVRKSN